MRPYGGDIFARIESAGFISCLATHEQKLVGIDPLKFGLNEKKPFFLFERADYQACLLEFEPVPLKLTQLD